MFETIELFRAENDGYTQHRIPMVCVTALGTVLAFTEARRTRHDSGEVDILMRRSVDGGRTFDEARKVDDWSGEVERDPWQRQRHSGVAGGNGRTSSNCVAIADRFGAVHLLYCIEYRRVFYRRSDDDGQTWSASVDITGAFDTLRERYPWRVIATGPGHGLQLRSGRILTPIWASRGSDGPGGDHRPSIVSSLYSDDSGATWRSGEIVASETEPAENPNETVSAELPDGRVLFNMRNESMRNRRLIATSSDGATNWSAPVFDEALFEPVCHAGLMCTGGDLFFSNPNPQETPLTPPITPNRARKNLMVRMSSDLGRTWPISRVIDPGRAGYSQLNVLPDGTLLCAYERSDDLDSDSCIYNQHVLVRFDRAWLLCNEESMDPAAMASSSCR